MNDTTKQTIINIYNEDIKRYKKDIKKYTISKDWFRMDIAKKNLQHTINELNKVNS